jgi:hypothetical protein
MLSTIDQLNPMEGEFKSRIPVDADFTPGMGSGTKGKTWRLKGGTGSLAGLGLEINPERWRNPLAKRSLKQKGLTD